MLLRPCFHSLLCLSVPLNVRVETNALHACSHLTPRKESPVYIVLRRLPSCWGLVIRRPGSFEGVGGDTARPRRVKGDTLRRGTLPRGMEGKAIPALRPRRFVFQHEVYVRRGERDRGARGAGRRYSGWGAVGGTGSGEGQAWSQLPWAGRVPLLCFSPSWHAPSLCLSLQTDPEQWKHEQLALSRETEGGKGFVLLKWFCHG